MKRGLSGKTRRGAPPIGRQRAGLRVVQATFLALAVYFGWMAWRAWDEFGIDAASINERLGLNSGSSAGEIAAYSLVAVGCLISFVIMGIRAVRGPNPPEL